MLFVASSKLALSFWISVWLSLELWDIPPGLKAPDKTPWTKTADEKPAPRTEKHQTVYGQNFSLRKKDHDFHLSDSRKSALKIEFLYGKERKFWHQLANSKNLVFTGENVS